MSIESYLSREEAYNSVLGAQLFLERQGKFFRYSARDEKMRKLRLQADTEENKTAIEKIVASNGIFNNIQVEIDVIAPNEWELYFDRKEKRILPAVIPSEWEDMEHKTETGTKSFRGISRISTGEVFEKMRAPFSDSFNGFPEGVSETNITNKEGEVVAIFKAEVWPANKAIAEFNLEEVVVDNENNIPVSQLSYLRRLEIEFTDGKTEKITIPNPEVFGDEIHVFFNNNPEKIEHGISIKGDPVEGVVFNEDKVVIINAPINTASGITALFHEHGHVKDYSELDDTTSLNTRRAKRLLKNDLSMSDKSKGLVLRSERYACAIQMKYTKKLLRKLGFSRVEIESYAYAVFDSYLRRMRLLPEFN